MIRRLLLLVSAACLCASVLLSTSAVAQQPGVEFAVEPGPKAQTAPQGGYFVIKANPGRRVRQSVALRNESGRPLTLELAAVDAITGQLGGVSYGLPADPVERMGAWVVLEDTKVSLAPGEARNVGFEVSVPADASPGEHIAGIAVWEAGEEAKGDKDQAVSIVVQTRRIIAVQVDLPGPTTPELVITGIDPAARPDGLYLEIGIANQGTAMTTGEGTVEIPAQGFLRDLFVDTFVPGTSIGYPVKWTEEPEEGEYRAVVEIVYDDDKVARWEGTFTVGDPVLEELEDRGGAVVGGGLPRWMVLAPAGIILLLGGTLFVRSRRGRAVVRGPQPRPWPAPRVEATPQPRPLPRNLSMPPPPPPPPPSPPLGGSTPPAPRS